MRVHGSNYIQNICELSYIGMATITEYKIITIDIKSI